MVIGSRFSLRLAATASALASTLLCLAASGTALADVEADYRSAVAADNPFVHYSFSGARGLSFSAPPEAPTPETITCGVWKDPGVKPPEAELYLECFQPASVGFPGGVSWHFLREARVLSAPPGSRKPVVIGRRPGPGYSPMRPIIEQVPLNGLQGLAAVARIELKAGSGDLDKQEWVIEPRTVRYIFPRIKIRPFSGNKPKESCPSQGNVRDGLNPAIGQANCIASSEADLSECASASSLDPDVGSGPGRYCLQRAGAKPVLQKGPFDGSSAMTLGSGESFLMAVPSTEQWNGRFTLEYWARWRGQFGGAVTMKFGDKSIGTGFACDGTGAATTFDVLSAPAVPPPKCPGLEGGSLSVVAASVGLSHSEWHHIALVRTRDEMQMWVDGARNHDGSVLDVPPTPTKVGIGIGEFSPATDTLLAEPSLYLEALTRAQISAHYEAGRKGPDTLCGIGNDDLFLGEASADKLSGGNGTDELVGGEGSDTLNGGAGNDKLDGGPGDDKTGDVPRPDCKGESLAGNDRIDAGPGNDNMQGGPGNDQMIGGPGKDKLDSGPGADVLNAADGEKDIINCGPGRDTVSADRVDKLIGCETVSR